MPSLPEVDDPFLEYADEDSTIFVDLTEKLGTKGKESLKVRLLQLSDPVTMKKQPSDMTLETYESKVVSKDCIEGVVPADELPKEGEIFKLKYHMFKGLMEFGVIESSTPIESLIIDESKSHYFKDSGGLWKLEVVTQFN